MSVHRRLFVAIGLFAVSRFCAYAVVDGGPYGIHSHVSRDEWVDFLRTYDMAVMSGIRWVRTDFDWARCESQPGKWDFSRFDRLVAEAGSRNLHVLPLLYGVPKRALPCERHLDEWTNYITRIVSRYAGRIPVWEVWNEPNGRLGSTNYLAILRAAYHAVKVADPSARVATAGFAGVPFDYIEELLRLGANDCYDIMNVHPYCQPFAPEDNVNERLHRLRELMAKYGGSAKPVWFTEIGWPTQRLVLRCGDVIRAGLRVVNPRREKWRIAFLKRCPDAPTAEGRQMTATLRDIMKGRAVVSECELAKLSERLASNDFDVLIFPCDESYPADAIAPAVEFVRRGGVVCLFGGHPLSYAWRRQADGTWIRDKKADERESCLSKFRIAKKAWWMDGRYPKENVMHPTETAFDFRFPSDLHDCGCCGRYFTDDLLRPGDRFVSILTGGVTNGVDTVGAAVYRFESDWKGAVVVSGMLERFTPGTDELLQADYLARTYALCCAEGVENCFWYEFRAPERRPDDPESHFGIVHADFRGKPALAALRTFITNRPANSIQLALVKEGDVRHLPWRLPDGVRAGMVWGTGEEKSYVLPLTGKLQFVDVLGRPVSFRQRSDGYVVNVKGSPVYYREVYPFCCEGETGK